MVRNESATDFQNAPSVEEVQEKIVNHVTSIFDWISKCSSISFFDFENQIVLKVFDLGKLFVALFLCMREKNCKLTHDPGCKCQGPKDRLLSTIFGKVRYWRTYIYRVGGGYYPLDIELGLPRDSFSMLLRSHAAKLATKMSYAQAVGVLTMFLRWSPSQKTVEEMVLGLGRHTQQWFESAPPPQGDGEVLIIQIDSKATPTATDEELLPPKRLLKRWF